MEKLSKEEFRSAMLNVKNMFQHVNGDVTRNWAEKIRPYDPKLAELYELEAEVKDKIRDHVLGIFESFKE
jgi:hypothetical protein